MNGKFTGVDARHVVDSMIEGLQELQKNGSQISIKLNFGFVVLPQKESLSTSAALSYFQGLKKSIAHFPKTDLFALEINVPFENPAEDDFLVRVQEIYTAKTTPDTKEEANKDGSELKEELGAKRVRKIQSK